MGKSVADSERRIMGIAFLGSEFTPENVELTIQNGIITDIEPSRSPAEQYILPAFFNAHTHLGDTVALDTPADRPLAELVAPPDGLKHRILRAASKEDLASGIRNSLQYMKQSGTLGFADFREGGMDGVEMLSSCMDCEMTALILGRDGGELHPKASGIGLSSAHGLASEFEAFDAVKKMGRITAVHAGEGKTTDIDAAFALQPDVIIHGTHFREQDIRRAADEGISVCLCPRSNWILHVSSSLEHPPVKQLLDAGVNLLLGTDNAMFVPPDMFSECAFLMTVYGVSAEDALKAATAGFNLAGQKTGIEKGNPANLTILDAAGLTSWSRKPLATALQRLGRASVTEVISSKRV